MYESFVNEATELAGFISVSQFSAFEIRTIHGLLFYIFIFSNYLNVE